MTHTPGPWVAKSGHNQTILGPNGEALAFTSFGKNIDDKTNAAFIVRACNSHEAMLEALKVAQAIINKDIDITEMDCEQIAKAIRLAEGRV
jgi:hypothetical protein